jgi:hypothetical protein
MIEALLSDAFTLQLLVFLTMVLLAGIIALEPQAAMGWSLVWGGVLGTLVGSALGLNRVLLAAAAAGAAACLAALYHKVGGSRAEGWRRWLRVGNWNPDGGIALQAGMGAVFGALMAVREFRHALADSVSSSGLLFVLIGTALSTLLIVPLHSVIVGEPRIHAQDNQEQQQRRHYLKPAVIFFCLFAVEYVSRAVEEAIKHSERSLTVIMLAVVTAGIVTWYWSGDTSGTAPRKLAGTRTNGRVWSHLGIAVCYGRNTPAVETNDGSIPAPRDFGPCLGPSGRP